MDMRPNVPLAPLTTFAIGGPAAWLSEAASVDDMRHAYAYAEEKSLPVVVLGGGSNVLAPDEGLRALVVRVANRGIIFDGTMMRVAAGENLIDAVRAAAGKGLGGLESLAGIPGTVGGAVRGNAGAFGTEIKDALVSATVLDARTGEVRALSNDECGFAYRTSRIKEHPGLIVLEAEFNLAPIEPMEADKRIMHTLAERTKRHIQDIKSAGSFFKNPVVSRELQELFEREKGAASKGGRVPAGWLMDRAGMRGARAGNAVASEYHTNYFLNAGNATAAQVKELAARAKREVHAKFGVLLEEEASVL